MEILITILMLVVNWRIFVKMGRKGWEGLIPLYNTYVMFDVLMGNGWKMFLLLIPIYNIYLIFKLYIELAHRFGKGTGFGVGLVFLYFIFGLILAFDSSAFSRAYTRQTYSNYNTGSIQYTPPAAQNTIPQSNNAMEDYISGELERLKELRDSGVFTEEEYQKFKADLLSRKR